jgi:hypothetical protein
MWIMTPEMFVSIVQKREDPIGVLTVRSRDMRSLQAFCALARIEQDRAVEKIETDYPFRLQAAQSEVDEAARNAVRQITYDNFKSEAQRVRGKVYANFLGRVWSAGLSLTPAPVQARVDAVWRSWSVPDPEPERTDREREVIADREELVADADAFGALDEWLERKETAEGRDMGSLDIGDMTEDEWIAFCESERVEGI